MNQFTAVVFQCLSSGAILTSLCATLVIPPFAWLAVRTLSPSIAAMHDDRHWQAGVSVTAAVLPGALFLLLVSFGMAQGWKSPCLQLTAGKVLYGVLAFLILASIVRSLVRAYGRYGEMRKMLENARPAVGRAAAIASDVGIPLFEIDDEREIVVMVANAPRQGAYVSTAALRQFDDEELRAALFHERAHIERQDHRIAPWLYFLTDLLPLPATDLIDVYRRSREFCADAFALAHVQRTDLASALLRVARGTAPASPRAAAAFAEHDAIYGRLDLLLRPKRQPQPNMFRRMLVTAAIALIFALGIAIPTIATLLAHCQTMGLSA